MIRSLSLCVALARQNVSYHESKRILLKFHPVITQDVAARSLHQTTLRFSEDETKTPKKGKERKGKRKEAQESPVSEEMKQAVVQVARSLPGNWTRNAEDLLARLQMQQQPEAEGKSEAESQEAEGDSKSLLSTMEVGRFMDQKPRRARMQRGRSGQQIGDGRQQATSSEMSVEMYEISTTEKMTEQRRMPRRQENFRDLFSSPRLGIFDAKKLQKEGESQEPASETDDLWLQMEAEHVRKALGGLPRNAFEEMTQWTKEGKLWKFPIDNESDMHEERKYKFYDHVFLEQHLTEFPDKGPIRKFMELMTLGLSNNPYLSPPEKVEHIRWFAQYFREKQDIIEAAVGKEQARMKEKGQGKLE